MKEEADADEADADDELIGPWRGSLNVTNSAKRCHARGRRRPWLLTAFHLAATAVALGLGIYATLYRPPASPRESSSISVLADVLARQKLRVATTGDYAPYSYFDDEGNRAGVDVSLAQDLGIDLGVQVEFVNTTWQTIMEGVGINWDIAISGITDTLERRKVAYFQPYFSESIKVFVGRIQILDHASRYTIGVNEGGTNEEFAERYVRTRGARAHLATFAENGAQFDALIDGRVDVVLTDSEEAHWWIKRGLLGDADGITNVTSSASSSSKAIMMPQDGPLKEWVAHWVRERQDVIRRILSEYGL